ncbi:MAG TPA: hypothetical protein VGK94_05930 [Candidatus Polarisedimenticolia bacterium]|jgi:hypothetical protein
MNDAGARGAHPTEDDLVLHHYGETGDDAAIAAHLAACEACRVEYEALARTLAMIGSAREPHRGEEYGARVWRRLEPRLGHARASGAPARAGAFLPRRWAVAAAVVMMAVAAFLAGRLSRAPVATSAIATREIPEQVRERILLVAVGDHLDRSQMMLVELLNEDGGGTVDITGRRERAGELAAEGRIYRQSATGAGDTALASVLDELERVLLDVAHGPGELTHAELEEIQRRIREKGILLKVRLIGSQVREREKTTAAGPVRQRT